MVRWAPYGVDESVDGRMRTKDNEDTVSDETEDSSPVAPYHLGGSPAAVARIHFFCLRDSLPPGCSIMGRAAPKKADLDGDVDERLSKVSKEVIERRVKFVQALCTNCTSQYDS